MKDYKSFCGSRGSWCIASSDVTQWPSCIVGIVGARFCEVKLSTSPVLGEKFKISQPLFKNTTPTSPTMLCQNVTSLEENKNPLFLFRGWQRSVQMHFPKTFSRQNPKYISKTRIPVMFMFTFMAKLFPQPAKAQLKGFFPSWSPSTWLSRLKRRVNCLPHPGLGHDSFPFFSQEWTCSLCWRKNQALLNSFLQSSHGILTENKDNIKTRISSVWETQYASHSYTFMCFSVLLIFCPRLSLKRTRFILTGVTCSRENS